MADQPTASLPVAASTRGSMERSIMIAFLALRAFYLVEATVWILVRYPVVTVGRDCARVMLVLLGAVAVGSVLLGRRMYRRRSVLVGRWPVALDLVVMTGALVAVSDHVMPADRSRQWGCVIYNVSLTSAVLLGTAMTSRRSAVRGGIAVGCGFWCIGALPFLAPWHGVVLTGLDASWLVTNYAIAATVVVVGRRLGDAADAARERVAELERERSRARVQVFLPFLEPQALSVPDEPATARRKRHLYRAMRAFVDGVESLPPTRFHRDSLRACWQCPVSRLRGPLAAPDRVVVGADSSTIGPSCRLVGHSPGHLLAREGHCQQALRDDIERKIVFAGSGLRGACLLVVALAAVAQGLNATWPAPHALVGLGVVAVESLALGVWTRRRGCLTAGRGPVVIDMLAAVAVLCVLLDPSAPVTASVWNLRVCTLVASAASFLGLAVRSPRWVAAGSVALSLVHVTVVAVAAWGQATVVAPAVAYASCGYWICAAVAWLFACRIRGLATRADTARARIVELERERSRAVVHDLLPYLRTERAQGTGGVVPAALARQTQAKYRQVKAYTDGVETGDDLPTRLESLFDLHPRLDIHASLDRTAGTYLSTEVSSRVERAVDTALANVEQIAPGTRVWVTAATRCGDIVVTIRDEGPGFDPTRTHLGYGIAKIIGEHLDEVGARGAVTSRPGGGTHVTITVPRSLP